LLWIYLRLLYTQTMLERFFRQTNEAKIHTDITRLEERLRSTTEEDNDSQKQKLRKALEDNLETCRQRLANFQKARDNSELIEAEIDHLENKIRALSELVVNRQDPEFILGQVDLVASSMVNTERTMNELQFATGLETGDDSVPAILRKNGASLAEEDEARSRTRRRGTER